LCKLTKLTNLYQELTQGRTIQQTSSPSPDWSVLGNQVPLRSAKIKQTGKLVKICFLCTICL
jgi:hypothetical protein